MLRAIIGMRIGSHCLSMVPCDRHSKEGLSSAGMGLGAPRSWPSVDHGLLPLPSPGRPSTGLGLLPRGALP